MPIFHSCIHRNSILSFSKIHASRFFKTSRFEKPFRLFSPKGKIVASQQKHRPERGVLMAIYHCSIKIGSRSAGKSAVASASYRAGERLKELETGLTHDYTRKKGVVHKEILLPAHAPKEYFNRETLWNAVQAIEKQKNAQLYREVEVALPKELDRQQQISLIRNYVTEQFVCEGMCADFAIHDKNDGNPHAHILLTTRPLKENGTWGVKERKGYKLDEKGERIPVIDPETGQQKVRVRKGKGAEKLWVRETVEANDWNDRSKAEKWRQSWAEECNKVLKPENQIDHRSYERQEIALEPTKHVGVVQHHMKAKGKSLEYDKTAINAEILQHNLFMERMRAAMYQFYEQIKQQMRELYERIRTTARNYGYVATTGELTCTTETTRNRDQTTNERVRRMARLMQETTRTDREIESIDTKLKEKGEELNVRIANLFARRAGTVAGRTSDRKRMASENEHPSTASDYRARADRAISGRENRDLERERQAIADRQAREMESRAEAERARERETYYRGPSL